VRCGGGIGACENCVRLKFDCSFSKANLGDQISLNDHGTGSKPVAILERRRTRKACVRCHKQKAKCSEGYPQCERCAVRGLECRYEASRMPSPAAASPPALMLVIVLMNVVVTFFTENVVISAQRKQS
jgi:hypothetical protein